MKHVPKRRLSVRRYRSHDDKDNADNGVSINALLLLLYEEEDQQTLQTYDDTARRI